MERCEPVRQQIIELRQYTLHPGARDTLIALFDREFIVPQEDAGMSLLGQFRVIDDPDRFFWIRGFSDMETRAAALAAFYGGPVWKAHRAAANETMIDSDDLLLMRPAGEAASFRFEGSGYGLYVANIYYFLGCAESAFVPHFEQRLAPVVAGAGARICAHLITLHSPNTFPTLPVRDNEHAFAWFAAFPQREAYDRYAEALARDLRWRDEFGVYSGSFRAVEVRKLTPTSGSRLH